MTSQHPSRNQTWSADSYDTHARFVSDLAGAVFDWLNPQPGEDILDLGCGDGDLTVKIAATGARVLGVDVSEDFLNAARGRGLAVQHMDGEALTFNNAFDAVFTNAALHWMTRPEKVLEGVSRALRPGGRFVGEFGGHGNVAAIVTAMRMAARIHGGDAALAGPWFFPSPPVYAELLEAHGFKVEDIGLFPRPTPLKSGMAEWLKVFREPFFDQFGERKQLVLDDVVSTLKPVLCDARGDWTADYVRIRFKARLS